MTTETNNEIIEQAAQTEAPAAKPTNSVDKAMRLTN